MSVRPARHLAAGDTAYVWGRCWRVEAVAGSVDGLVEVTARRAGDGAARALLLPGDTEVLVVGGDR